MVVSCEVDDCNFSTPRMGRDVYPAMVAHLQVHSAVKHGIPIDKGDNLLGSHQVDDKSRSRSQTGGHRQGRPHLGFEQAEDTRPGRTSSQPARSRTPETRAADNRGRSLSRSRGLGLQFPCTDCNMRSFDTEVGLFTHRRKVCGLRGAKPTSLDFPCPTCPRAFTTPMGVNSHKKYCKGGGPHTSNSNRRDSSSVGGVDQGNGILRTRVDIPKMRREVASQEQEKTSGGDNNPEREVVVVGMEERNGHNEQGGSSKRKKTEMRDTTKNSSSQGSSRRGEMQGSSRRVERNSSSQGSNQRGERNGSSRSEATTSAGPREAWVVKNGSANRALVDMEEEEDLPRKKVAMEVTMRLPGGQMATVMYRVGADAEMRKVIDKVANKLGKPASKVRLYCTSSTSNLASSIVSSRDGASSNVSSSSAVSSIVSFGGGDNSGNLSNMAAVEGGSLAIRFQDMKLLAIVE